MAYSQDCSKNSVTQYLQGAILQLLNDHVCYAETLQVLGVLCITVDNKKDEVVIKVNSTLKRVTSLTPPKESSPDLKRNNVSISRGKQSNQTLLYDSKEQEDVDVYLDGGRQLSTASESRLACKSRGRKQLKPAKVNVVECEGVCNNDVDDEDEEETGDARGEFMENLSSGECNNITGEFDGEEAGADKPVVAIKRKYSSDVHENGIQVDFSSADLSNSFSGLKYMNNINNNVCIKTESQDEISYSDVGLDLSSKRVEKVSRGGGRSRFDRVSSSDVRGWPDESMMYSPSILQSTLLRDLPACENYLYAASSAGGKNQFVTLFNHPSSFQTHALNFRKILPSGNLDDAHFRSTMNQDSKFLIPESFEFKTEDDYLLDCLSSDGKKRRRRGLEDALTADEVHEYLGSREIPPASTSFSCRICGEATPDLLKYFHHTLSCHKAFICHQCGRCFTTKSSLLRHRPIHTGLRRFACGICRKAFYRKDKCKAHIKKHTEAQEDLGGSKNLQIL